MPQKKFFYLFLFIYLIVLFDGCAKFSIGRLKFVREDVYLASKEGIDEKPTTTNSIESSLTEIGKEHKEVGVTKTDSGTVLVNLWINFDFGSAEIKSDGEVILHKIADVLNTFPESAIAIEGHTDNIGTDIFNLYLSQERANNAKKLLTTKEGISESRFLACIGYGESQPLTTNDTEAGRAQNRRIKLIIYDKAERYKMTPATAITGVSIKDDKVTIIGNGILKIGKHMVVENDRVAVDIYNVILVVDKKEIKVDKGNIKSVRLGFHDEQKNFFTRVVVDVKRSTKYSIKEDKNNIIIEF